MKKVLVVIDMQNDFIDGILGSPEAQKILPRVCERIEDAIKNNYDIIFTKDTHSADYLNTEEGKKLPIKHCIKGSYGWEFPDALKIYAKNVIEKGQFGTLKLVDYLQNDKPEIVEILGLCTDICVINNAMIIKAALPESKIFVNSACCAGTSPENHLTALSAMSACHIDII